MHTKYKTCQVNQIISYSRQHCQFLSTAYLAITFSYYLSFTVPVLAGVQYLPLGLFLWMWWPKASQWEPQALQKLLSTLQNWNCWVPRQDSDNVKHRSSSPQNTSALSTVIRCVLSWNQSGFEHLFFVVARFWISATFSLCTTGMFIIT